MHWRTLLARHITDLLLVFLILVIGVVKYADISPQEKQRIELEAGLEQLYLLEQAFNKKFERYFDPLDPTEGFDWPWMAAFEWEVSAGPDSFWVSAKADLDGDGAVGVWRIDERGPQIQIVVED